MTAITERKQVKIGESSLDSNQGEYYAFHINDIRMATKTLQDRAGGSGGTDMPIMMRHDIPT